MAAGAAVASNSGGILGGSGLLLFAFGAGASLVVALVAVGIYCLVKRRGKKVLGGGIGNERKAPPPPPPPAGKPPKHAFVPFSQWATKHSALGGGGGGNKGG